MNNHYDPYSDYDGHRDNDDLRSHSSHAGASQQSRSQHRKELIQPRQITQLPQIKQNFLTKRELHDIKLMEDKRRLIRASLGREPDRPIRDQKAWLSKSSRSQSEIFNEYSKVIEADIDVRNKKADVVLSRFQKDRAM